MKIKTLLIQAIAILTIALVACDDNLNQIGNSIQPDGDKIFVGTDTVFITARTVSFKDSVYSRTVNGLLGEYIDPVFGKVKADYMSEFYCPEGIKFATGALIDSINLNTEFMYFTGDSVAPMGMSVYAVKNPLKAFFFTSVDPSKYIGEDPVLYGQKVFSIQDLPDTTITQNSTKYKFKYIRTKLDINLAHKFHEEWKTNPETFKNQENFNEFFKGLYITTTFGSGALINTNSTELVIYYRNFVKDSANKDSLVYSTFKLPISSDVIQMNQIKNDIPSYLYEDNKTKTYLKTPAGVYTEITIPLKAILEKGEKEYGKNHTINAANFKMLGFTEEEEKSGLGRASNLLFINKDSLTNFFYNKKQPDNRVSFLISRTSSNNSYNFGNLSTIINHYADFYKDKEEIPDLKYLIIPVSASYKTVNSQSVLSGVYNQMYPTSTILRTDSSNMKMGVIYSKYNNRNQAQ